MSLLRLAAPCLSLLLAACASSSSSPDAAPSATGAGGAGPAPSSATSAASTTSAATSATSAVPAPTGAPTGSAYAAVQGAGRQAIAIAPGASCAAHGGPVAKGPSAVRRSGSKLSVSERWGCGCPARPVFSLVYEPGSSPLSVRLCEDPTADRCEALCQADLTWDLTELLRAEGETDFVVVP
jgi:hypothetical protein